MPTDARGRRSRNSLHVVGSLFVAGLLLVPVLGFAQSGPILYLYDDLNRLVRVIRGDGEASTFQYDGVGNLLRVTRESGLPADEVVSQISTATLPRGRTTTVTITGVNLAGAIITTPAGVRITSQVTGVDTVVLQLTVDPTAPLGSGTLTIATPYATANVPVTVEASGGAPRSTTFSDAAGNFTLLSPPSGPNMLFVDGRTGSTTEAQFPIVEVQVTVAASGPTRVPFPIYLPILDTANKVTLPLDANGFTTQTVIATTPRIPGLEITIPQGTRIIDGSGNPVAELVITPVPVDRSPMPFPPGVMAPLLFAINPGGAVPSQPLPISFPNVVEAAPGATADLYYFDLAIGNWNTWGTGTVSAGAEQVVSDPGDGLPRLAWHLFDILRDGLRRLWKALTGGDPVDLATGIFSIDKTDLVLPARIPISIQRTYRSDDNRSGFFGIGWNLGLYDSRITSNGITLNLITADQNVIQLRQTVPGQWVSSDPTLLGAVVTQLAGEFNFQIRYKDGTVHRYDRIVGFSNTAGLAAITDRNNNTVTLTRQSPGAGQFGQITRITEPAGRFFTLTYDTANRITSVTDPLNRIVRYTYDAQGRLETVTDPANGVTRYAYDAQHRITSITDARNITYLTNEYDAQGRVVRQTQADTGVWTFAYTTIAGNLSETTVTDPRGHATTHRFNSFGLPLSTTDALGQTTTTEYTPGTNLVASTTDPLGRTTRFGYDARGNVTSVTDAANNTTTFTYDTTFNRVTSITDALTQVTSFEYDTAGNLTAVVDPLTDRTTIAYNAFGQPTSTTNPLTHTTTFTYDANGNLATIADPLANTTTRQYDVAGRLTRELDPRRRATNFQYDAMNRLTTITDATNGVTRFTHDANGNLLTVTDARNNITSHMYDSMDRLASRTDPANATETFGYDGNGNLTHHTDRKQQVATFTYDALNRPATAVYVDAAVTYRYDAIGRLITATDTAGGTIENEYDVLDRLVRQTQPLGAVSYQYDALGRRTHMQAPGAAPVIYGYDTASRLTSITQAPLNPVTFEYDNAGRRTKLTLPNQVSTEYQYDMASRLTALIYRHATNVLGNLTYAYDPAGHRTKVEGSFARTLLPDAVAAATYGAGNRQLQFSDQTLTFDANGNTTSIAGSAGMTSLTWDARNRLRTIEGAGTTAVFSYSFGRRQSKNINGTTTAYLHDGADVVQRLDSLGSTTYLRSLLIDEALVLSRPDIVVTPIVDALGSTIALTNTSAALITQYEYSAFGATISTGQTFAEAPQFTGRDNDEVSALYYYRSRYYHPILQRFISEDPIGVLSSDLNLYGYVGNQPIGLVDPTGFDRDDLLILDLEAELNLIDVEEAGFGGVARVIANLLAKALPRLKWGAAAAPVVARTVQFDKDRTTHIFRTAPGHLNPATAASRERLARLFEVGASNSANYRADLPKSRDAAQAGVQAFTQTFRSGKQVWVYVLNGKIVNAGVNVPGARR